MMSGHQSGKSSLLAVMSALGVSALITLELAVLLFGGAYGLFEGLLRNVALAASGMICVIFFIRFLLHAYKVERELLEEGKEPPENEP
jgi:hypothetical protein